MATKTYKKFLTGAATAAMVASAVAPVAAQGVAETAQNAFTDVGPNDYYMEITEGRTLEFFSGYPDGKFKPYNKLTRSDAVKMFAKYVLSTKDMTLDEYVKEYKLDSYDNFTDIPDSFNDKELINYAKIVKREGIFTGSAGKLNPYENMQRQQMATTIARAFELENKEGTPNVTDLDKAEASHRENVEILAENGVTNQTTFRPAETVNRGQFATFLVRAHKVAEGLDPSLPIAPIESVNALDDITIKVGQTPELPQTVGVTFENGSTGTAKVEWNTDSLDNKTVGTYKLTGDVEGTDLSASINVIVESDELGDITEAEITTTVVDDDKDAQYIEFTVNNRTISVNDLVNKYGYEVEFQATKNVFESAKSSLTTSATGEIAEGEIKINDAFDVKIVLKRDGVVTESKFASVKVVNLNATPEIGDLSIKNLTKGFELNSNTLVIGEKYDVGDLVSETGDTIFESGVPVTYTSSKPAIALVNAENGVITPVAPGNVTITATVGDKTASVDLVVTNQERELATATVASDSYKLAQTAKRDIGVSVKDQYGDPFVFVNGDITATTSSDKTNQAITVPNKRVNYVSPGVGTLAVNVSKDAPKGNYEIYLRAEDFTSPLDTIGIEVTKGNTVVTSKTQLEPSAVADLNVNEYTVDGGFVATATAKAVDTPTKSVVVKGKSGDYTVEVANDKVAKLKVDEVGNIDVVGLKNGKTDITVTHNGILVDTFTWTVDIPTIEVTKVNFVDAPTVIAKGEKINVYDVLDIDRVDNDDIVKGIELNVDTTNFVRKRSDNDQIYLDVNDNGKWDGDNSEDVYLGDFNLTSAEFADNRFVAPTPETGAYTFTTNAGDEGVLVFKFTKADGDVTASTTVKVAVPGTSTTK